MTRAGFLTGARSSPATAGLVVIGVLAASLLLYGCGSGSSTVPSASGEPLPSYWGAWIGSQFTGKEAPWDMRAADAFEAEAEKAPSLIGFSSPFADCGSSPCSMEPFQTAAFESIRRRGAIPFFSWASDSVPVSPDEPDFQLADVVDGRYDPYIRKFAAAAKAWGHPFFLRFNWEMNADWFPWAARANGNTAAEYVAAWRHVHDIFTAVGADDATWVWCPYADPQGTLEPLPSLYPGDAYVDWTCLDVYNWGDSVTTGGAWHSFAELARSSYREITESIAPSKPMLIGEVASAEAGGSKPEWIRQMFEALPTEFPRLRGLIWFDKEEGGTGWPIGTSRATTEAFAQGIAAESFAADSFGSIDSSPIAPP